MSEFASQTEIWNIWEASGSDRAAFSDIMAKADILGAQIEELRTLFVSIVGDGDIALAIYNGSGRLCSGSLNRAFPTRLAREITSSSQDRIVVEEDGCNVAYMRIEGTSRPAAHIFATVASSQTPQETITNLGRTGAAFLARTLNLIDQTGMLQQLVQEQRAMVDHMTDGLLLVDRDGVLRYLNAPGGRMLGIDPAKSVGRTLREVLDFEPYITPIFETKVGYTDRELQIQSSKVNLHIIDTAVPVLDAEGNVASIVNTFHEIARAKQLSNRMAGDRARYRFSDIVGKSSKIHEAVSIARKAARSDANILLYGESGTGKEVFAQSIHNDGRRASASFVAVNCAALPRDLIESELFGYSPGSFTGADKAGRLGRFELAAGGTIFLDEISEMPLDVQAKLLRVLQERQVTRIGGASSISVDVRVIAAANRNLSEMVARKAFREDLFYRLNVLSIDLPPLRSRRDDIELLAEHSIQRYCTLLHRPPIKLSSAALFTLRHYDWPGNVRQLENIIERLVNMTDGDQVPEIPPGWLTDNKSAGGGERTSEVTTLADAERSTIAAALVAADGNITKASSMLGITRPTLYKKLHKYRIVS